MVSKPAFRAACAADQNHPPNHAIPERYPSLMTLDKPEQFALLNHQAEPVEAARAVITLAKLIVEFHNIQVSSVFG
jgi:hypothetical protein